jgi:hypothetical protein
VMVAMTRSPFSAHFIAGSRTGYQSFIALV